MLNFFHIVIKLWDFIYFFLLLYNKLFWGHMYNLEPEAKPAENNCNYRIWTNLKLFPHAVA